MKVKRYIAKDMTQALKQIRDELGGDAAILSNRQIRGGVEVVAAIEYDPSILAETNDAPKLAEDTVTLKTVSPATPTVSLPQHTPTPNQGMQWIGDPTLEAMRDEIHVLRHLLEHQLTGLAWRHLEHESPLQSKLLKRLYDLGLSTTLSHEITQSIAQYHNEKEAWEKMLNRLAEKMMIESENILETGGAIALVGATGVGKTTTLAKLAAKMVWQYGAEHVALITTDSYRIAAHEQLRSYATILGIAVKVAENSQDFIQAMHKFREKRAILIDTPGLSQRDVRLTEQMTLLQNAGRQVNNYLVLPATNQRLVIEESIAAFQPCSLRGCVITKVDEATSLGGIFSASIKYQLPIAYLSNGQRIPDDLMLADKKTLIHHALHLAQQYPETRTEEKIAYAFIQGENDALKQPE